MTVPHEVWRAVESIPRQRGPYGTCTCEQCKADRDREANADAARAVRSEA